MSALALHTRLQHLLHLYLPAGLMALLALGTWWLVRNTTAPAAPTPSAAAVRHMDYEMADFATAVYAASGAAMQTLQGAHLAHYNTQELDIRQVQLQRSDSVGSAVRHTQARAARAQGQDDGSDITLSGQVHLRQTQTGAEALQVQAQQLRVYADGERLQGSGGVRISRGKLDVQAQSMAWDGREAVLTMQQRVQAQVQP